MALYRQDVVLRRPVRTGAQDHVSRSRLFLRLNHDDVVGYGEVAPQLEELNGDPSFDAVLDAVRAGLTRLQEIVDREGSLPSWSRVARLGAATPASNVAGALIEMAVLDRELHLTSRTIEELWGARFATPRQVTFSLLNDDGPWEVDETVARVRVKIAPGALSARALDRLALLSVPVLVDYNCSAIDDDAVIDQVALIRNVVTISAVEQPYAVGNVADHARLARRLGVPLSLDEGVRSLRDLSQIASYRAAAMVCVKPARVGGLANARTMFARAEQLTLGAYLGGFFESSFARRVHCHLANSCVREPSDLTTVLIGAGDVEEVTDVAGGFGVEPSAFVLDGALRLSVTRDFQS